MTWDTQRLGTVGDFQNCEKPNDLGHGTPGGTRAGSPDPRLGGAGAGTPVPREARFNYKSYSISCQAGFFTFTSEDRNNKNKLENFRTHNQNIR